ncbi:MAG TPA: phosphoribosylformylglycinamidine cyclo-ligase [Candidatus Methanofastidiosa archaeon]|nr:phosphoribosylformylglycinamidine cyclo-ligase [Candidatus Methanofastidiosa archaeon]
MDYASSGVDIRTEEEAVKAISDIVKESLSFRKGRVGEPLTGLGHFSGVVDIGNGKALAISTDGVGTKLLVAKELGTYRTVGIDAIAMNVNDIICCGATPISFVDTVSVQSHDNDVMAQLGEGLLAGAKESEIAIVGGETATVPDILKGDGDGLDLMGTAIGIVDKDKIITGMDISPGDVVLGIESSGLHSNGYSLARKVVPKDEYYILLEPTRIYVKPILALLKEVRPTGLVHITGTGLLNLKRLKEGMGFRIEMPDPLAPFSAVQHLAEASDEEMYKTFNMGIGFMVMVRKEDAERAQKMLNRFFPTFMLGEVTDTGVIEAMLPSGKMIKL